MLLEMRKVTRGAFASIILGLIGFAMVLFLIPRQGIQNPFSGNYLAKVGGTEISANDVNRELDARLQRMRANGQNISREDAIQQGAHLQLLDGLILRAAVANYARNNGVIASDVQVAARIRDMGVVDPTTHRFDAARYAQMLSENHLSGPQFEQLIRGEISSTMMLESLAAGVRIPSSFGAMAVTMATETRTTTVAQAPISLAGNVAPPTQDQLQTFYNEVKDRLQLPEFRQLTLVFARKADFAARANITEDQIRQEFNNRAPRLGTPEKRSSVRIAAQSQAQANDIAARINAGQSPDAVAQAMHVQVVRGVDETHDAVTDPKVADAVFAMAPNAPARAVQGQLTWTVVKTLSVTPGVQAQYSAYHDQIKSELQNAAASEQIDTAINNFEEARAAGSSVGQAAQTAQLTVVAVPAVEAQGRDMHGQPAPALAGQTELLRAAFHTAEGEASDFMQVTDGEALVSVDHITPPHARPLADIHDQLAQLWRAREINRRMTDLTNQVAQAVQHGQDFATVARAHHMQIVMTSAALNHDAVGRIPAAQFAGQIFSALPNAVVTDECAQRPQQPIGGLCAQGNEFLIAHVERINHIDLATAPQLVEQARTQVQQEIAQSFGEALEQQIIADAHTQKNQQQIARAYPPNGNAGDSGDEGQ